MPGSRVSVVLLTCNCERYVAEALRSALAQEFEPFEFIISDDASTDATFERIESELDRYDGPHEVVLRRRSSNSGGKSAHLNDVLKTVSGEIVVFFDGDDVSRASRVRETIEATRVSADVRAVYSSYSLMDERGRDLGPGNVPHAPPGFDARVWFAAVDAYASGGTLAICRSVFDKFGDLPPDINEDVVLPFRASLLGSVVYLDAPLVKVRRHSQGVTQDYDRFASFDNYRSRILRGVAQARRQRESRLADLETAMTMQPERIEELEALREVIHRSARAAEDSVGLVSPSLRRRLLALWKTRRHVALRGGLARDVALALAPETYLRYKRRRLGIVKDGSE